MKKKRWKQQSDTTIHDICAQIKFAVSCTFVASQMLGLPITHSGDRCMSPFPGEHHTDTAFWCFDDHWVDFSAQKARDVIELLRWVKYNGNRAAAIRELCELADIDSRFDESSFKKYKDALTQLQSDVERWHKNLRPEDIDYLHARRINDTTIEDLKVGYSGGDCSKSKTAERLTIAYILNGEVVYWAGRKRCAEDALGPDGKTPSKYYKCPCDNGIENIICGQNTLTRKDKTILHTRFGDFRKDEILFMTEGMVDWMSIYQEGFHTISPNGGYFAKELMNQIRDICKAHKIVVTAFDSDSRGQSFTKNMAEFFMANQIKFLCVDLRGIKDINDYYVQGLTAPEDCTDEFLKGNLNYLVEQAEDGVLVYPRLIHDAGELKEFLFKQAQFMDKVDLTRMAASASETLPKDVVSQIKRDALKGPTEMMLVDSILEEHNLKYIAKYLRGVIEKSLPVKSFFRSRFFTEAITYPTETVSFEFANDRRRLLPYTSAHAGSVPVERDSYQLRTYLPPLLSGSRVITPDSLAMKNIGEVEWNSGITPDERARQIAMRDLDVLQRALFRKEEYMCARVKQDEKLDIKGPGINAEIDYGFVNLSDESSNQWTENYDIMSKLQEKANILMQAGITPDMLILGMNASIALLKNKGFQKMKHDDLVRFEESEMNRRDGANYMCTVLIPGLFLKVYNYPEMYYDEESGTNKPLIDTGTAILQSSDERNIMLYGAVTYLGKDDEYVSAMGRYIPYVVSKRDPDMKKLILSSRSLPMPRDAEAWYVMKNCA